MCHNCGIEETKLLKIFFFIKYHLSFRRWDAPIGVHAYTLQASTQILLVQGGLPKAPLNIEGGETCEGDFEARLISLLAFKI